MKITCVENDADGISRFRTLDVPLTPSGDIGSLSKRLGVVGAISAKVKSGIETATSTIEQRSDASFNTDQ